MADERESTFDLGKAVAATAFLIEQTGASMYSLMKMMYLADKTHLGKHGRFISGDSYCAMKEGPVPSHTYNMVKVIRGEKKDAELELAREFFAYADNHSVRIIKRPDLDELSDSDIECLEEVARVYKSMGKWAVRDLAHDNAWQKTWTAKRFGQSKPMSVDSIASELDCATELLAHLRDPAPGSA